MRFRYSTTSSTQDEFDSLPRLPLTLRFGDQEMEVMGLVDSGATVNVLPYEVGIELGAQWEEQKATIPLADNIGKQLAMPFFVMATVGNYEPVHLAFAWVNTPNMPLILGQTNFFMEFDVHFYRSRLEFEVEPKS
ncbi:MAG: hypothetical protein IT327_09035 [Anaerolineae bacterium]|nr:hypothetical protein [Anaerolineae bacterium]